MMKALTPVLVLAVASVGLSGCTGFRQALGVERTSPDEFAVLRQSPLVIPPEFELRPPEPGAERRSAVLEPRGQARTTVFGEGAMQPMDGLSPGERALLDGAEAATADPDIIALIEWETEGRMSDPDLASRVLAFRGPQRIVDPIGETRRLERNAESGRDATDGETPTVEGPEESGGDDDGGFLDWLWPF